MAKQPVDTEGKIVPYDESAALAIERATEEEIVESLTSPDHQPFFAYSYPIKTKDGTKEIIGISVEGAKEIARQLGNIEVLQDVKVEEREGYFYAIVRSKDLLRNIILPGVGRQSKYVLGERNEPTDRLDELCFVKSFSKAVRNSILSIAPQETIARIIAGLDPKKIKKLPIPKGVETKFQKPEPDWNSFWQQVKDLKLSEKQAHEILNVTSIKDWVSSGKTLHEALTILIDKTPKETEEPKTVKSELEKIGAKKVEIKTEKQSLIIDWKSLGYGLPDEQNEIRKEIYALCLKFMELEDIQGRKLPKDNEFKDFFGNKSTIAMPKEELMQYLLKAQNAVHLNSFFESSSQQDKELFLSTLTSTSSKKRISQLSNDDMLAAIKKLKQQESIEPEHLPF